MLPNEALRDLVRAREAAKKVSTESAPPAGEIPYYVMVNSGRRELKAWTKKHREWIKSHVRFEEATHWKLRWPITSMRWTMFAIAS